jgi:hypothetical protein
MGITRNSFFQYRVLLLFLFLALVVACGSRDQFIGTYQAEGKDSAKQVETTIELKANGDGAWKSGGEEIPFSWYIKSGELRIHTKGGAVIVGSLEKDTIQVSLFNNDKMTFKKVR